MKYIKNMQYTHDIKIEAFPRIDDNTTAIQQELGRPRKKNKMSNNGVSITTTNTAIKNVKCKKSM